LHPPTKKSSTLLKNFTGNLCLDVGCGEGAYLNSFNGQVVAIDVHSPSLKKAKENHSGKSFFILGDARSLPFRDGVFNVVLSASVVEHISQCDTDKYFSELERVANDLILVEAPNMSFLQELLRAIVYKTKLRLTPNLHKESSDPLLHRSFWTKGKLEQRGFKTNGCLGWVTREQVRIGFVADLYDFLFWHLPSLAGTIIATKNVK